MGETGLGKSTFVNTLFASHLVDLPKLNVADIRKTTEIEKQSFLIEENGVQMKLTVVDTPGYGDNVNNDNW